MNDLFQQAAAAHQRGDLRAAEQGYQRLLELAPDFHPAWHGLGVLAHQAGQHRIAVDLFARAIALEPNSAAYLNNLGNTLKALGNFQAAADRYRRALAIAPDLASAANNLGNALQALGDIDGATIALERAAAITPEDSRVQNNLANLLKEQGRLDEALNAYQAAAENPNFREAHGNFLAALKLSVKHTPEQVFALHKEAGRKLEQAFLTGYTPLENIPDPGRRLTVAYMSPDCHTAVPAFVIPVLRRHDPARFRIICYFNNPQPPERDPEIAAKVERRIMAGMSDQQVSQAIRQDHVDILVDIAGHTGFNRLAVFAARSAPVQLTWLDYLNTTGLSSMDYRLTDGVADPPGISDLLHSETLWRLPETQWCWEPPASAAAVTNLPALANRAITFGSFNNYSKLTDATLALWARLLEHLSEARLMIVGAAPGTCQQRVRRIFGATAQRVAFAPRVAVAEYRALIGEVDIALDPLPFSGATTTLDALWQGVPVLTLTGRFSASRSTASILTSVGLTGWVAADQEEYLAIAARWAEDLSGLADLRAGLRERLRRSPVTDAARFTDCLESAYLEMWKRWASTDVEPNAPMVAESKNPGAQRQRDLLLQHANNQIRQGDTVSGISSLLKVLRYQQNWHLAHRDLALAALQWARAHPELVAEQVPAPQPANRDLRLVSAIICSIDPEKFASVSTNLRERLGDHPHEIIGVHDAKSLCEGYNRGARQSRGDILIFCHDDIEIATPDFAPRLLAHLRRYDGVGVCGTTRLTDGDWGKAGQPWIHGQVIHGKAGESGHILLVNGSQALVVERTQAWDGLFFAVRRKVWEQLKFDEQTFDGFHLYDVDFSFRAFLAGFNLAVATDLLLIHHSTGRYDTKWRYYNKRFRSKFAGQLADPPDNIPGSLNCKLQTMEQVNLLRAALLHFRYGAAQTDDFIV